ncbi:MAG: sensor histidine kinase [Pseudomonadota bacterium]|nr:sensor histidine kinase [Pseudomonadota bacterium]
MNESELARLARYLRQRRDAILEAWRESVRKDPLMSTGDSLPPAQLNDHIPAVLAGFERELLDSSGAAGPVVAASNESAAAHGLHRWQQGYDLREVTRELGKLNECVVAELEDYANSSDSALDRVAIAKARRLWAAACGVGIEESTAQYFRLQQLEASGHVKDLEQALEGVRELERQRAELWQQVAHDLRNNVGVVASATKGLGHVRATEPLRDKFLRMLERNVSSLHDLLDDVTSLARLQAGREERQLAVVDIAELLGKFCEGLLPVAQQRHLYLRWNGTAPFIVEADAVKTRRLVQNLVLNAIKYTREGGVSVTWGDSDSGDRKRWALTVQDTGPGFAAGPGAPMAGALEEATQGTHSTAAMAPAGDAVDATHAQAEPATAAELHRSGPGEGIGLSIVKRLCELLNATIELESDAGVGTTVRVLLPRRYSEPASIGST